MARAFLEGRMDYMGPFLSPIRGRVSRATGRALPSPLGCVRLCCRHTSKNWDQCIANLFLALQNKISELYCTPNSNTLCVLLRAVIVFHSQRAEVRQPRQPHYYIPLLEMPQGPRRAWHSQIASLYLRFHWRPYPILSFYSLPASQNSLTINE